MSKSKIEGKKPEKLLLDGSELTKNVTPNLQGENQLTMLFLELKKSRAKTDPAVTINDQEMIEIWDIVDKLIAKYGIEKIRINEKKYLLVASNSTNDYNNAENILNFAIEFKDSLKKYKLDKTTKNESELTFRMGVHSGINTSLTDTKKKYKPDNWGALGDIATEILVNCEKNKINISQQTYNLIKANYDCEFYGKILMKGKHETPIYFVHGLKNKAINFEKIEKHILKLLKNGLNASLHYHGYPHTIDVINNVKFLAEKEHITDDDLHLLKMAALFHDLGFLEAYSGHEEVGCRMAQAMLPSYQVLESEIEEICKMIMATRVPQTPHTLLEKILCDADLLYLGTDEFVKTGNTLYKELVENGKIKTEKEWNQLQANFLLKHHFHTRYCIENYTKKKEENLKSINNWLVDHQ